MTRTELEQFRAILHAKHVEAMQALTRRDGLTIERTPDALDEVQFAAAQEFSTRNLERESNRLRELRAALDRIGAGTYGECLTCEKEIGLKRLRAVPSASLCIACQEKQDPEGGSRPEYPGNLLRKAA